jgi:hypothetical protein
MNVTNPCHEQKLCIYKYFAKVHLDIYDFLKRPYPDKIRLDSHLATIQLIYNPHAATSLSPVVTTKTGTCSVSDSDLYLTNQKEI